MTRRIPYTGPVPYMAGSRIEAKGYRPTPASRFAVVRVSKDAPWLLIHCRTGMAVASLLPCTLKPLGLAEKLAVAGAWETLTHCDWTAFDSLPELGPSFNGKASLDPSAPGVANTVAEMRQLAAQTLA